jgi:hypothetical protein
MTRRGGSRKLILGLCVFMLGIAAVSAGVLGMVGIINLSIVFSDTPASIGASYYGVLYEDQEATINACLLKSLGGTRDPAFANQLLILYIDGIQKDTGTTDSSFYATNLHWTPTEAGTYTYKITWAGCTEYPDGAWLSGDIYISPPGQPQPAKPTQTWLYVCLLAAGASLSLAGLALMNVKGRGKP